MTFHLATGEPIPPDEVPTPKPTFHPVLGFTLTEQEQK